MKNSFCFSKDLKIILYGVSIHSENLYYSLDNAGYTVSCFFDRRYMELKDKLPIPVYSITDNPYLKLNKDKFCVIITLQNAIQHDSIAIELLAQGYCKIIFVPMKSKLKEEIELNLRFQYNILLTNQFHMLKDIPILHKNMLEKEVLAEHSIIKQEGKYLIIWCPTELLYTEFLREKKSSQALRYSNVPLYTFFPYINLFEYLQGNGNIIQPYFNEYGVNKRKFKDSFTDEDYLLQRRDLLEVYKQKLNQGMDFFISSAPRAEWNQQFGVFNLQEGHHRSVFLIMQEFRYIPIRISQDDFNRWNISVAKENILVDYLAEKRINLPLLNPKYKKVNESADRNHVLQLESIQKYLCGDQNISKGMLNRKTVLDVSHTYGYYARNAVRMHAEKIVSYKTSLDITEIEKTIHEIEQIKGIKTLTDWKEVEKETYSSIFVIDALMDISSKEEKEKWIERYSKLCAEECFVLIRSSSDMELWGQYFSKIQTLRQVFSYTPEQGGGNTVKLCVLQKNKS